MESTNVLCPSIEAALFPVLARYVYCEIYCSVASHVVRSLLVGWSTPLDFCSIQTGKLQITMLMILKQAVIIQKFHTNHSPSLSYTDQHMGLEHTSIFNFQLKHSKT